MKFSYWNRTYDLERATFATSQSEINVVTKESKLGRYADQKGFYAKFGLTIGSLFRAGASYQNLVGNNWNDEKTKEYAHCKKRERKKNAYLNVNENDYQ